MSRPSPPPPYNPENWYWIVGTVTGHVFSSYRAAWVIPTDAIYMLWSARNRTTPVPDTETLVAVLTALGLTTAATAAATPPG